MIKDNYECEGQMDIFAFLDKNPVREPCGRRCEVDCWSRRCYEKRGQVWDYHHNQWMRNNQGEILVMKAECDWHPGSKRQEPHHCDGCLWKYMGRKEEFCEIVELYEEIFKCNMKITAEEGWHRIFKVSQRGYNGEFPECPKWQKIEIWSYIEEFDKYVHGFAEAKDKTIKRNPGGDIGEVTAWRYV